MAWSQHDGGVVAAGEKCSLLSPSASLLRITAPCIVGAFLAPTILVYLAISVDWTEMAPTQVVEHDTCAILWRLKRDAMKDEQKQTDSRV